MKKFSLLKLFSITAFAMAGALAVANAKGSKKAESVKADTYSGSVIIQKNDNDAKWDGCYLASYLFDDSHNTWGPKVANTSAKYQTYSWSGVSFNPTTIIMLRVPSNWESSWDNPWWAGEGGIYARTGNVTLSSTDVIWMAGNANESSNWGTYQLDAVVKGYDKDSDGAEVVSTPLSGVKISDDGSKVEAYGSVSLPADTYFKVLKEGTVWCGSYDGPDVVKSNLSGGGSSNIHNTEAANYEIFFDYDGLSSWITDPVLAEADQWAHDFLTVNCQATLAQWSTMSARYISGMSGGAQALLAGEEHVAHNVEVTGNIKQAVQRYDYVIERYGTSTYNDFMGRVEAGKVIPGSLAALDVNYNNNNPTNLIVIVSIVSLISASTLVGLIVIKKRKSISK